MNNESDSDRTPEETAPGAEAEAEAPAQWPTPEALQAAAHMALARASARDAFSALRAEFLGALRADLSIDRASRWHRLVSRSRRTKPSGESEVEPGGTQEAGGSERLP